MPNIFHRLALALFAFGCLAAGTTTLARADWLGNDHNGHTCDPNGSSQALYDVDCPDIVTACLSQANMSTLYEIAPIYYTGTQEFRHVHCRRTAFNYSYHVTDTTCDAGQRGLPTSFTGCIPDEPDRLLGDPMCASPQTKNPINIATGNKFKAVTDFSTADGRLHFTRYYNSYEEWVSPMGTAWRHSLLYIIQIHSGSKIIAWRPDGRRVTFLKSGGVWSSDSDIVLKLEEVTNGYSITDANDRVETYLNGENITTLTHRGGYEITFNRVDGKLSDVVDNYGRSLSFAYNGDDFIDSVTDPDGWVYSYDYQSPYEASTGAWDPTSTLLSSVTYPDDTPLDEDDNAREIYHYEDPVMLAGLTGITDENGVRYETYDYDSLGRAIYSEKAGGEETYDVAYHSDGTRTVTNPLGKQSVFHFTTINGVKKVTLVEGQATAHCAAADQEVGYDSNGFVNRRVDWNGNETTYVKNARGLETSRSEAVGTPEARTITTTWHATYRRPTQIVEPGRTTDFVYDGDGNLTGRTVTDTTTHTQPYSTAGETRTWTYTYNATGQLLTIDGPRTDVTDVTTFTYDAEGNRTEVENALNQSTLITAHNERGLPLAATDPNGVDFTLAFDPRGRLTEWTLQDPDGGDATTSFTYDPVGQIVSMARPDGSQFFYAYDPAQRLVAISNALGERIDYGLDAMGNRTSETVTSAGGQIKLSLTRAFDELGRLLDQVGAAGQTMTYSYDPNGNQTGSIDPNNEVTTQAFDALNRLIEVTDPLLGLTTFDYDGVDNLTEVTDPLGNTTFYTYNGFGDVIEIDSPDTGITEFLLDAAGNRIQQVDARGIQVDFTYDALNRLASESYPAAPAEDATFSYDATAGGNHGIGRLTGIADETGSSAIAYDLRGNRVEETRVIGGLSYTTSYAYDLADNLTAITYPDGRIVTYQRDELGRVSAIRTQADAASPPQSLVSAIAYLPFGPVESLTYANGLVADYAYDQDYRLTGITTGDSGGDVQDLTIVYDDADNITAITDHLDAARTQSFTYDALNRLETASGLYGSYAYGYDANGNRQSRDLTGGPQESHLTEALSNRLTSVTAGGITRGFTYDAAGNMTADDRGADPDLAFSFDQSGRLAQVTEGGLTVGDYGVNALGQRVEKTAGGATRHFHYGPSGVLLSESDGLGDLVVSTIYLEGLPIAQVTPALGGGGPIDVIVDNSDPGATASGGWLIESGSGDHLGPDYDLYEPESGPGGAGQILDNAGPGFSMEGPWPLLTSPAGFHGANYRGRIRNQGLAAEQIIDNSDPAFVARGDWETSTSCCGHIGADFRKLPTNGLPPEAQFVDDIDAAFSVGGSTWEVSTTSGYWGGSGHYRQNIEMPTEAIIVDNTDPNTARVGTWKTGSKTGKYGSNYHYVATPATGGTRTFTWTPVFPAAGAYKVFTRSRTSSGYANDAPFTIHHDGGSTTVDVNQRVHKGLWKHLGTFDFTPGQDQGIVLSDDFESSKYILADAVAFVPDEAPMTPAIWTPELSEAGDFDVFVRWKQGANRPTAALYSVYHDGGVSEFTRDQTTGGGQWELLGSFSMTPGQNHRVEVTHMEPGKTLIADAIRYEPVGTRPPNGIWHFQVEAEDDYDLYAIWRNWIDYPTNTPYHISHAGGLDTYLADQKNIGETWMLMGTYRFEAGEDYQVEITGEANGEKVSADAIKLVPQTATPRTASWSFQVPSSGNYAIHATWAADGDRASDAPFTITHDGGSSTVTMNQRQGGGLWHSLGDYDFTAGANYTVTLSDDANGLVVADALYLVPSDTTNVPFTWSASLPQAGPYQVYARWPADASRTTAAVYEITHELGTDAVTVNQRANGGQWVLLGTYDFDPAVADAEVTLEGFANGSVAADAIRFVQAGTGAPPEVAYLHSDQLGRPQKITDASGLLAWDRTQTPFGQTVTETGFENTALRFPGQYADTETGLHYNYFRDYDPSLGRYVSSDPIGLYGGLSTYGYVDGRPLSWSDPFGLKPFPDNFIGPLPPDGYYISEMTDTKCGLIPPAPPLADIYGNMQDAQSNWNPLWFYNQVRGKGPWDYKQKSRKYEDFGNFNFGATGTAFGLSKGILRRGAGWANQQASSNRQHLGNPLGDYPYGDDYHDQVMIDNGINFCTCELGTK